MKCNICGKFRKEEDLHSAGEPDSHFGPEDFYWICIFCIEKEKKK